MEDILVNPEFSKPCTVYIASVTTLFFLGIPFSHATDHTRRTRGSGNGGIGQAIALELAKRGATVIATDLTMPHETVSKIGPAAHGFQLDVTQEEAWRSVSLESRDLGDVDIVVNNAGYFPNRPIDELDLATWRRTIATNVDSHFLSAKFFLPTMRKKKWGRFVGISSNMFGLAIPGMSHYIDIPAYVRGFFRTSRFAAVTTCAYRARETVKQSHGVAPLMLITETGTTPPLEGTGKRLPPAVKKTSSG
jgi:NAD(P)-dependent dehydrogenase (short-subunit alcohol dehydrogenase family)